MVHRSHPSSRPLVVALALNAAFSSATAAVSLIRPSLLAPHLGGSELLVQSVGGALIGFVVYLLFAIGGVRRDPPQAALALGAVVLDAAWVLTTLGMLPFVGGRLTDVGVGLVVAVAIVVAMLGRRQYVGIGRLFAEPDPRRTTEYRAEISVEVAVGAPRLWPVIADLGRIGTHFDALREVALQGDPGTGAVRTCSNASGQCWSEEVIEWNAGRSLTLRFVSEAPDFPYPLDPMVGGWELTPRGDHACRVTLWWSFTTRPRWIGPAVVPLLLLRQGPAMRRTIASMEALSLEMTMLDNEAA